MELPTKKFDGGKKGQGNLFAKERHNIGGSFPEKKGRQEKSEGRSKIIKQKTAAQEKQKR